MLGLMCVYILSKPAFRTLYTSFAQIAHQYQSSCDLAYWKSVVFRFVLSRFTLILNRLNDLLISIKTTAFLQTIKTSL